MQGFDESRRAQKRKTAHGENGESRAALGGPIFHDRQARDRQRRGDEGAMHPLRLGDDAGKREYSGQDRQGEAMDKAQPRQADG